MRPRGPKPAPLIFARPGISIGQCGVESLRRSSGDAGESSVFSGDELHIAAYFFFSASFSSATVSGDWFSASLIICSTSSP